MMTMMMMQIMPMNTQRMTTLTKLMTKTLKHVITAVTMKLTKMMLKM